MEKVKPVVLCILDGWGHREDTQHNAIYKAKTPFWDGMIASCPNALLYTSGLHVGLPEGQMGNSEVGHMNIGSGRVVLQELPRIDSAIENGEIAENKSIKAAIDKLKSTNKSIHIMGLMSDGGVHSHQRHIVAFVDLFAKNGIKVNLHLFTDGRDTPPTSSINFIKEIKDQSLIKTICGRYYAMDRDNRWERVESAYDAIIEGRGQNFKNANDCIAKFHQDNVTDEFIPACTIGDYQGAEDGDAFIMVNFRSDRVRQILASFVEQDFTGFVRKKTVDFAYKIGMVEYSAKLASQLDILFPAQKYENILGSVIEKNNLTQLRIAETEKYAHVTFFFNCGKEDPFAGEQRILVQSPQVKTYDEKPEMSAYEVTDKLIDAIKSDQFDVIIVNYANTDMVGHTGDEGAAIKAVEAIDKCLARLVPVVEDAGGVILITADHGNAEMMYDESIGQVHTSHTTGPVPIVVAGANKEQYKVKNGKLADIAPTMLKIIGIDIPAEMSGEVLLS